MLRQLGPMFKTEAQQLAGAISSTGTPLASADDLDPLLDNIGDAQIVLLGEASHGTSEYYTWRARLSRRLIAEKGFSFIAVEGDWPDCYTVNRYIKGYEKSGETAVDVLHEFDRWPTWMWANWEVAALAEWLRGYNEGRPSSQQAGFYGLDVYSLWESMDAVMGYLEEHAPESLDTARRAYHCFEPYGEDVQAYARSTALVPSTCEGEVIDLLQEVRQQAQQYAADPEAAFNAEQNAWVTAEAERYYRTMVRGGATSWNVRDYHMADTLDRLLEYHGQNARAIVWEHNTHIGDARYTDMHRNEMVNVGQIVRERHERNGVVLVGCGSYQGSVIASQEWGAPMARMRMPPGIAGSWENVLHEATADDHSPDRLFLMEELAGVEQAKEWRGHRAIGVVYHPDHEYGNYVPSVLPRRYDAFLFFDQSEALHPLHVEPAEGGPPDTYPWGF